ncbi:hypothetical protein [Albirhodobacter sp. R86504]|uniref:hypothetical protein n=1 Tax=Albirhodobacter sp. R86504 TaxID=3093848 RepID=UPI003670029B
MCFMCEMAQRKIAACGSPIDATYSPEEVVAEVSTGIDVSTGEIYAARFETGDARGDTATTATMSAGDTFQGVLSSAGDRDCWSAPTEVVHQLG